MPKLFYFAEILKFAVEKEIESYDLYRKLGDLSKDEKAKNLFQTLMQEEKKHKAFYENMLSGIETEQYAFAPEDEEEYKLYMETLIATSRGTPAITEAQLNNTMYALDYAISREKDSILFYVGLKNFLPMGQRDKVDAIIAQEGQHMYKLYNFKHMCFSHLVLKYSAETHKHEELPPHKGNVLLFFYVIIS